MELERRVACREMEMGGTVQQLWHTEERARGPVLFGRCDGCAPQESSRVMSEMNSII